MACQLAGELSDIEARLPQEEAMLAPGGATFRFDRKALPELPPVLTTQAIQIRKRYKFYDDCYRVDVLHFMAPRKTYRHLGLSILSVVFSSRPRKLDVKLDSPESEIKSIKIAYSGTTTRSILDYRTIPFSFEYFPEEVEEYPWKNFRVRDDGWPDFRLVYSGSKDWQHWEKRDVIEGFGNDDASVLLAALLLNFGRDENRQYVIKLESIMGRGGVSKFSAEAQFHLPESGEWPG